jgi:hypothetical protein
MAPPPAHSRGVEYALDLNDSTATKVWEYIHPGQVYSPAMGNYQRLNDQQHHLVSYGFLFRPDPSVTLVDANENILTELFFADSTFAYRTRLRNLNFTFPQPTVVCNQNGGTITLSAPMGFADYLWSTGETGPSIVVADTGTYIVWVDFGIGMLGSIPFVLDDLSSPCSVSIDERTELSTPELIGIYDLLGRAVTESSQSKVLIYRYSDGSSQKKVRVIDFR